MLFFSVVCVIFLQKKNQSEWDIALSIFLVFLLLLLLLINGAAGSCTLWFSTFLWFRSAFAKKKKKRATQFTLQNWVLSFPSPSPSPPFCGPKELKSFNINRAYLYHSSIVNYRVWYLCASGKPRDITGSRLSGLGCRERRKPWENIGVHYGDELI